MKVATIIDITDKQIQDLLEYGFNNSDWFSCSANDIRTESERFNGELNVQKQILLGGNCNIYDINNANIKIGCINITKIHKALQSMAIGENLNGDKNPVLKEYFFRFINNDSDMVIDKTILQIAIMNDMIKS